MKALTFFLLCAAAAWPQAAPAPAAPAAEKGDAVIVTFADGSPMTLDQFQTLVPTLPAQLQQMARQDREHFLHVYDMYRRAADLARGKKLDQRSPYRESLDFTIMSALADFAVKDAAEAATIEPAEIEKYYNDHKEPFKQIKVSGLKVAFGSTPEPPAASSTALASRVPKKALTEEEAKAKAEKLVAQIRGGADFAKLVQTESDDEASKAKGGDLGTWKMTDNVPDLMRTTVFGLKQGEVSDPVRQAGGYYLFHADLITYAPLADVRDSIFTQLKQMRAQQWMQDFDKNTKETFPGKPAPAPAGPGK
jgi:hypothetical protein